jgi:hypothetical protein
MKKSFKLAAFIVVLAIYAALILAVVTFVDASNAGLHMTP